MIGLLAAWLLLLPVANLFASIFAVRAARNASIPIARRRFLYRRILLGGVFGAIGVHATMVAITLPTRMLEPVSQLWFGMRFALLAVEVIAFGLPISLLPLCFAHFREPTLLGATPEEIAQSDQLTLHPLDKRANPQLIRRIGVAGFSAMGGLLVLDLAPSFAYYRIVPTLIILVGFGSNRAMDAVRKHAVYVVSPDALANLEARLHATVERMAANLRMPAPAARVLLSANLPVFMGRAGPLGIEATVHAVEYLTQEELDYLVAHELAHIREKHRVPPRFAWLWMLMPVAPPLCVVLLRGVIGFSPLVAFSAGLVGVASGGLVLYFASRQEQKRDFEADRIAVEATGDPDAAIRTLRKIALTTSQPGMSSDLSRHPTVRARIAALGGTA